MEQLDVEIIEATLVTPSEPTPTHILHLSALDSQPFLRFTIEYLLVYPPCPHHDRATVAARIKDGLERALVSYYPLAGRVRAQASGSGLEVVCQAQGAVFIEAVSNVPVYEFEGAPCNPDHWRKFLTLQVSDLLRGPPLVVQLTWLADGGAAVGVGLSHCICDGIGSGEFLNSWAEFVTGRRGLGGARPMPRWERHLLDPMHPPSRAVPHPEFDQVEDLCHFSTRLARERLAPTAVCFNHGHIAELKKLAMKGTKWANSGQLPSLPSEFLFTSFEVLAAHVWRCWVRAMGLVDRQTVRLIFSINARKRVEPNLPEGYYGNGFVLGCAQTTVKDLREKGLRWAARLVRKAKERVDDNYVRSVVEAVSESGASPDSVGVLILSQWSRLGLERVDFGLGRPVHVGPICSDKYCLFLPVSNDEDAVKVMLAVPKSVVAKYEHLLKNP